MARRQPTPRKTFAVTREHQQASPPTMARRRWPGRRHFTRVLTLLRELLPPRYPVVVHTTQRFATRYGDCCRRGRQFRIRVSRELSDAIATETLLHEWAHTLAWDPALEKAARRGRFTRYELEGLSHGPKWGLAYSKVYATYGTTIAPQLLSEDLNKPIFRRIERNAGRRRASEAERVVRA